MALKLRRRQKLFPGFYLNFSSKGVSATVGIKGLNVNFNKTGTYLNTGIPGTGLYDRKKIGGKSNKNNLKYGYEDVGFEEEQYVFIPQKLEGEIKSQKADEVTSKSLQDLKETLIAAFGEKNDIKIEALKIEKQVNIAKIINISSKILIFGFFIKWFDKNYKEKAEYWDNLRKQYDDCKVNIEINLEDTKKDEYNNLINAFTKLQGCEKVWDMTSSIDNDDNRSMASNNVTRENTSIELNSIAFLNTDYEAMYFENINGSDIYIYPSFIVLFDNKDNFGLVELNEVEIIYSDSNFLEEDNVPDDAELIGSTWAKVNKNGTPDKRFKGNYEIPIVKYGELTFKSKTGIHEVFLFSNAKTPQKFATVFNKFRK